MTSTAASQPATLLVPETAPPTIAVVCEIPTIPTQGSKEVLHESELRTISA
jgi:hypothetical protein